MEWIHFKDAIVAALGLSRDSLHLLGGLGLFGLVVLALRCRARNPLPWLCTFTATFANEALDQMAGYAFKGSLDWSASLHDLGYTLLLPTLVMTAACALRMLPKPVSRRRAYSHHLQRRAAAAPARHY